MEPARRCPAPRRSAAPTPHTKENAAMARTIPAFVSSGAGSPAWRNNDVKGPGIFDRLAGRAADHARGQGDERDEVEGLKAGADDYIATDGTCPALSGAAPVSGPYPSHNGECHASIQGP